ncbi:MAG: DUF885 domain-containing protein [Methylomonas sp.]
MTSDRRSQLARTLLSCLAAVLFFTCQPLAAKSNLPAWDSFVGQFIESYFSLHPSFAINAGRHEFDGKIADWSHAGLGKQKQWLESERQSAERYRISELNETERFEHQYLLAVINEQLFWLESVQAPFKNPIFYSHALDPSIYVTRPYLPVEERLRAFIEYAQNVPKAAAQIRANLKPPFPLTYIDLGKTIFGGLAKYYETDAKAAFAQVADPKLRKQYDIAIPLAVKAMRDLAAWMEQQRPNATADFALGAVRFREMLKATEGVDLPLDVLEKAGRDDMQRNLTELDEACKQYAQNESTAACVAKVESHKPADGTLAEASRQLSLLRAFITEKNIVSIPSQELATVAESPPFKRWNSAYIDVPGPYERGLKSIYYVAPPDPAWSAAEQAAYLPSKANLLFISAHEVWPGHFLQHLHANQAHSKFGQLFGSYAFSEGWAHYSEELMWESGLNAGDAETHIGQLLNALLRNVRFLSAIGLHTQGMSVANSEKMFRELAFRDEGNARQQAARGTFDPGYLNYTLGKLMIRKLREDWTASRGGRDAWKSFHDTFLSYGAPPIPLVRKAMLGADSGSDL